MITNYFEAIKVYKVGDRFQIKSTWVLLANNDMNLKPGDVVTALAYAREDDSNKLLIDTAFGRIHSYWLEPTGSEENKVEDAVCHCNVMIGPCQCEVGQAQLRKEREGQI